MCKELLASVANIGLPLEAVLLTSCAILIGPGVRTIEFLDLNSLAFEPNLLFLIKEELFPAVYIHNFLTDGTDWLASRSPLLNFLKDSASTGELFGWRRVIILMLEFWLLWIDLLKSSLVANFLTKVILELTLFEHISFRLLA